MAVEAAADLSHSVSVQALLYQAELLHIGITGIKDGQILQAFFKFNTLFCSACFYEVFSASMQASSGHNEPWRGTTQ